MEWSAHLPIVGGGGVTRVLCWVMCNDRNNEVERKKRMEEGRATQLLQKWKENQQYKGEAENKRWIKNGQR